MSECACGSGKEYSECCEPLIKGERKAETAEELLRSRYSAYAKVEADYLLNTLAPDQRENHDDEGTREWAEKSEWHGLEILKTEAGGPGDEEGDVEFVASYTFDGIRQKHHELAHFTKEEGTWYFENGEPVTETFVRSEPKVGRNDPCPCGSGKKYKKCCGAA